MKAVELIVERISLDPVYLFVDLITMKNWGGISLGRYKLLKYQAEHIVLCCSRRLVLDESRIRELL